jgi:hypothetical protein
MGTESPLSTLKRIDSLCHPIFWQTFALMPNSEDQAQKTRPTEPAAADQPVVATAALPKPREAGGREGPEPTRFGDWELRGRCIDF